MIPTGQKGPGKPRKDRSTIVGNLRRFPVDQRWGGDNPAAEDLADCLVAQAHSQDGHFPGEVSDRLDEDARIGGPSGSGRKNQCLRRARFDFAHRYLVVALDFQLGAQFSEQLHQVVRKRIVVIEDEDHRGVPPLSSWAMAMALSSALPLLRVSSYSLSGTESATMPAPT